MPASESRPEPTGSDLAAFGLDDTEAWLDHVRAVTTPESLGCIGPYEIIREIARGGQGVVYEARRPDDGMRFALKRLLAGALATDSSRRRFERELAVAVSLSHPHIVNVLGMEVIDGEPLLAMEWVDGQAVTDWAGIGRVTVRSRNERLDVFLRICDAVHYAHQNGVIHRDLKPTNILVDRDDEPRVLDFGLAKQTRIAADTLTRASQFMGTPAYAAPEQLSDLPHAVDVRADAYALGIILYQLVTGRMPYPTEGSLPSVLDHIRYSDPMRPSSIGVAVDRDLEAILFKSLAKQPDDRYQSVEALATDLRRYRAEEPILAHTPGWTYVIRKTLRRHPVAFPLGVVSVVCVVVFGLLAGAFGLAAMKARREEAGARRIAEASSGFLQDLLSKADPNQHGGDVKLVSLLEEAAGRVEQELRSEPEAAADVLMTIGSTYYSLWLTKRSEAYFRRALTLYRSVHGDTHPDVARCLGVLGSVLSFQDRREAVDCQREALRINRTLYGEKHPIVADSIHGLGFALYRGASPPDYDGAESCLLEALAMKRSLFAEPNASIAITLHAYAAMMSRQGRHAESIAMYERVLRMNQSVYGDDSSRVLECLDDYAAALVRAGRYAEAEPMQEEAVAMAERLLGTRWSAVVLARLADTQRRLGHADLAALLCGESMRRYFIMLATDPPDTPPGVGGFLLRWDSVPQDASRSDFRRDLLETAAALPHDRHVNAAGYCEILMIYARALVDVGALDDALVAAREALRLRTQSLEPGQWRTAESKYLVGRILAQRGDRERAEVMWQEALAELRASRGEENQLTREVRDALAQHPWPE